MNERWADLSPVPGDGQGWLEAVEPVFRPALRSALLLAAATGEPGCADCLLAGPWGGRRSRWWWQPSPPGGLVVCVAVIDGGPAGGWPVAGDARGPVARHHTRAALPAGISAELAMAAVHRIFQAGLALESAASLLPGPAATLVLGVVDDLDQLVRGIRDAVLQQPGRRAAPEAPDEVQSRAGKAAITAATPQLAGRAGELLDSVVNGIFTAGMSLQAAIGSSLPEAAAQCITEALRCLEEVIREVRGHVFTAQGQQVQPGHAARPGPDARERRELAANHTEALREHGTALRERGAELRERGAELRQRVAQRAYAVYLAAADTAALLEQQGDLAGQPGRIDYPTEIKRWRAFADQAKQIAERWEHP
ncbi:MAG TPA: hypothetical protein VEG33_16170 [Streptosporangiaceae bacterium]|nr:hypothetical protein [Streptosporangiaceae bacterium]